MRAMHFRVWIKSGFDEGIKPFMAEVETIDWVNEEYFADDETWAFTDCDLLQSTELVDKNGKEIYEGDLLKRLDRIFEVKFDERQAAFQAVNIKDSADADFFNWLSFGNYATLVTKDVSQYQDANCEIIGNVYETPNLCQK